MQHFRIQQIAVLEHFGLMIARMDKGKDACLLVFALAELRSALQNGTVVQRKQCQQHKIPGTKGSTFPWAEIFYQTSFLFCKITYILFPNLENLA